MANKLKLDNVGVKPPANYCHAVISVGGLLSCVACLGFTGYTGLLPANVGGYACNFLRKQPWATYSLTRHLVHVMGMVYNYAQNICCQLLDNLCI